MMWRLSVGNFMHLARYETPRLLASENMPCYIEKPPRYNRATACQRGPFGRRPPAPRRRLDLSAIGGFQKASRLQLGAEPGSEFSCAVDDLTTDHGRADETVVA